MCRKNRRLISHCIKCTTSLYIIFTVLLGPISSASWKHCAIIIIEFNTKPTAYTAIIIMSLRNKIGIVMNSVRHLRVIGTQPSIKCPTFLHRIRGLLQIFVIPYILRIIDRFTILILQIFENYTVLIIESNLPLVSNIRPLQIIFLRITVCRYISACGRILIGPDSGNALCIILIIIIFKSACRDKHFQTRNRKFTQIQGIGKCTGLYFIDRPR